MKKYLALLLAVVFAVSLFAACGNNQGTGSNSDANNSGSVSNDSGNDEPQMDMEADNRTTTYSYRGFEITLPDGYFKNGYGNWMSDEEKTDIIASHIYYSIMEDNYGIAAGPLEDMAKAFVESNGVIEGELLKGEGDYYYVLEEDEFDGEPWVRIYLFYTTEEAFWEVTFYSSSRSWADVEDQWSSYIETIQFS